MPTREAHLLCNAHLDPVWLWEWEEGAAEALSTFRLAVEMFVQLIDAAIHVIRGRPGGTGKPGRRYGNLG